MENQDNPEDRINGKYKDGKALAEDNTQNQYSTKQALSDLNPGNVPDKPAKGQPQKSFRREPIRSDPRTAPEENSAYPEESRASRDTDPDEQPSTENSRNGSSRPDADLKWLDDPQTLYLRKKLHVPDAISFVGNLAQVLSSSCVSDAMKKMKLMADLIASTDQVPYPVFAIDTDGKVIAWNKEMERVTEIPAHDMIGKGDHAYAVPFYGKARPMLVDYLILPNPGSDAGISRDVLSSKPETVRILGRFQLMWGRGTRIYDENGTIIAAVQSIGINDPVPPGKQVEREKAANEIISDFESLAEPVTPARQRFPFPGESPEPANGIARPPAGKAADPLPGAQAARKRTEDLRNTLGRLVVKEEELLWNTGALSPERQPVREHDADDSGQRVAQDDMLRNIEALSQDRPLRERAPAVRLEVKEEMLPRDSGTVSRDMRQIVPGGSESHEDLFEQVISNAREGIIAFDTSLKCLLWNTFMEQLTGIPEDDVLGRRAFDMFPPLKEAGANLLLEQALSGKTVESSDISCRIPISGKQAWVRLIVSALRDNNQDIIGIIGIVQDSTARKVMEYTLQTTIMQLMESEEKYRSVFNAKNDPLLLIDTASRRIMDLNTAVVDLYGYQREEFFRLSPADLFTEPEKFNKLLDQKSPGLCLSRQRKKDGIIFPADVSYATFELKGRRILILSIRDLSTAYQTADALRLANTKLNLLIGVTRHDVLNNLTVLMGYNDLMKHTVRDGKILEMLDKEEIALKAVQRQIDFTREYYNLGVKSPLWQNVCEISTRAYSQFITTVHFTCDTQDLEVYADPLLEKVFYNLFDNAIRHGERITHVRIYCAREGPELVLIFGDDGRGIRPENKDRIFKRGFGKHTGLGLFLTREILAITRIDIAETGEFEKGARFELRIPAGMFRFPEADNPIKVSGSETMNLHAW